MAFVKDGGVFCDGFQKRPNATWKALPDFEELFRQLLISLMMKERWQWIFYLNLGSKPRNK